MSEKESILIVDDDESTRRSLELIFAAKGFATEKAATGREAREKARARFFNVAFLDIKLPDVEGVDLVASLKEMHPDTAVIMSTAYATVENAVRALNNGASAYVTKPLNMDEVLATMGGVLEKQRLVVENRRLYEAARRELEERRRAEEKLRLLRSAIEQSSDGVAVSDIEGRLQFVNNAFAAMHGYTAEELVGAHFSLFHTPEQKERAETAHRRVRAHGEFEGEVPHARRDGSVFPARVHSCVFRDEAGKPRGIIETVADITYRKRAEEADQLKRLSEMLIGFQEEERKRVARELHDELGQVLTAIRLSLGMIVKDHADLAPPVRQEIEETIHLSKEAMDEVHRLSSRLRPEMLDNFGLIPCIEHEVAFMSERGKIPIAFTFDEMEHRLSPQKEIALYRMVQEALTNVVKHAHASAAEVSLRKSNNAVLLRIRDEGKGFPAARGGASRGLGLLGMRERIASVGGELRISSQPGKGTVIEAKVPC